MVYQYYCSKTAKPTLDIVFTKTFGVVWLSRLRHLLLLIQIRHRVHLVHEVVKLHIHNVVHLYIGTLLVLAAAQELPWLCWKIKVIVVFALLLTLEIRYISFCGWHIYSLWHHEWVYPWEGLLLSCVDVGGFLLSQCLLLHLLLLLLLLLTERLEHPVFTWCLLGFLFNLLCLDVSEFEGSLIFETSCDSCLSTLTAAHEPFIHLLVLTSHDLMVLLMLQKRLYPRYQVFVRKYKIVFCQDRPVLRILSSLRTVHWLAVLSKFEVGLILIFVFVELCLGCLSYTDVVALFVLW